MKIILREEEKKPHKYEANDSYSLNDQTVFNENRENVRCAVKMCTVGKKQTRT